MPVSNAPIMIVDDNQMDIDFILQAFKELDCINPLLIYRDGIEAIQHIESQLILPNPQLPVLIFLDLHMPKVDGLEVLRLARSYPGWNNIPIIVFSTSKEHKDIAASYESGASSYITKPMDNDEFTEIIEIIYKYWIMTDLNPNQY